MTPFFAQSLPEPTAFASAAEKWGVIGVLSVFIALLIGALWYCIRLVEKKQSEIDEEKDKAILERDKRIETERQAAAKYAERLEAMQARNDTERMSFVDIAKATKQSLDTLSSTIERDQRSRP